MDPELQFWEALCDICTAVELWEAYLRNAQSEFKAFQQPCK